VSIVAETSIQADLDHLHQQGYVVIPSLLSRGQIGRIKAELAPYLRGTLRGRNDFEGFETERVYALLAKAPVIAELVEHPRILPILDRLLAPNYLLSANLAIQLYPGETRQPLHFDDGFYKVPRPRRAYGVSTIWAIDEFTTDNGATEIIAGSHLWGAERPAEDDPRIESVIMPAGSVIVFMGTLWHRGGANQSAAPRLAITPQYCEPWLRQIENQVLAVPREMAAKCSQRVQELLGYSIHPPFMGYVDGVHPRRLIDPSHGARSGEPAA
jgi:ectoine hydroxylase-related dioxygenase (phytanoyl-CoA dioxygenase family)